MVHVEAASNASVPFTDDYLGDRATEALLEFLERRRLELGLSHNGFARWLGMNTSTWSLVRRALAPAGPAFVGRVLTACPEAASVIRTPENAG